MLGCRGGVSAHTLVHTLTCACSHLHTCTHSYTCSTQLQAARNKLAAATDAIVKKLMYYESARPVLVYHELRQFRELQTRFFTLCVSSFEVREQLGMRDDDDDLHLHGDSSTGSSSMNSGFPLTFRPVSPTVALQQ